jgi:glycosyltransferase involved in cell wall biosynthesis
VVAARVLGVTEAVRDGKTGMLFPVDDAQVLAGKLATLLLDASLRERLRNAGLLAARRQFSAGRMAQETLAVYRQALAGGGGSLLRLA